MARPEASSSPFDGHPRPRDEELSSTDDHLPTDDGKPPNTGLVSGNGHQNRRRGVFVGRPRIPEQVPREDPSNAFRLVTPLGSRTWRCLYDGGRPAAARWIGREVGSSTPDNSLLGRLTDLPTDHLVPVLGLARDRAAVWLVSELNEGVTLHRFLQVVGLSALQAVTIAADVLDALQTLHAAGIGHGLLRADKVYIGRDGRIRLGAWAATAIQDGSRFDWEVVDPRAYARLVARLADAARRRQAGPAARQDLLTALDEIVHLEPAPQTLGEAEAILASVLDDAHRSLAWAELAALTADVATPGRAVADSATADSEHTVPVAEPVISTTRPSPAPAKAAAYARPRRRPGRIWVGILGTLVTLLLLSGLVAAEFWALRDKIDSNIETILDVPPGGKQQPAPPPGATPAPSQPPGKNQTGSSPQGPTAPLPQRGPVAVPTLAPAAAGMITGVETRTVSKCAPNGVCSMITMIRVWPQEEALQVRWDVVVIDRCTGRQETRPGGIAEVAPGGDRMEGVTQVALPKSGSLAVVAVTSLPDKAASPAVLVPATGGTC